YMIEALPCESGSSGAQSIGASVLPFVRPLIDGPTPLHGIFKPRAGAGAGLLAELSAGIFSYPKLLPLPDSESEVQRTILSTLRDMPATILIDNVTELGGSALPSAITATRFTGRLL